MKKLPPGEAAARHQERNRLKNEQRKINLIEYKLKSGSIKNISEARKKQMREYIRTKRGLPIADPINLFLNMTPEQIKEKKRQIKNAKQRLKRDALRAAGKPIDSTPRIRRSAKRIPTKQEGLAKAKIRATVKRKNIRETKFAVDKRLKESKAILHGAIKQPVVAKPKPKLSKVKKMGKVVEAPKPLIIRNNSLDGKVKLIINPKLTVYIRPDQDPDLIRAKYLKL